MLISSKIMTSRQSRYNKPLLNKIQIQRILKVLEQDLTRVVFYHQMHCRWEPKRLNRVRISFQYHKLQWTRWQVKWVMQIILIHSQSINMGQCLLVRFRTTTTITKVQCSSIFHKCRISSNFIKTWIVWLATPMATHSIRIVVIIITYQTTFKDNKLASIKCKMWARTKTE